MRRIAIALAIAAASASIVVVYTARLADVPPHLGHDEVLFALNAQSIADSGTGMDGARFPLLFSDGALGPYGREPLSIYATALVLRTIRRDDVAVRLASALVGLLDVVLMYFVARRLFGAAIAAAAALLLACAPAHVFYGREGVEVVYMLPFILGWLSLILRAAESSGPRQWGWAAAGAAMLSLSIYAYKAAQIVAPAYLCLTLAFLTDWGKRLRTERQASLAIAGVSIAAFAAVGLPYAIAAMSHPERYAKFSSTYAVGDPNLSFLQNLHDFLRYENLGEHLRYYYESFSPRWLFFSGDGAWTDSTRRAGIFLVPTALPLAAALYDWLTQERARVWSFAICGFFLAAVPSFVTNEVSARRMIAILPFGVLLTLRGFTIIVRRWRHGSAIAMLIVAASCLHFAVYVRDYLVDYPLRSYQAWELNLKGAIQSLAERDAALGRRARVLVVVENTYIREYLRLYARQFGDASLAERARYAQLTDRADVETVSSNDLLLRQILPGESGRSLCGSNGFTRDHEIREPVGNPSFVVCER